MRCAAAMQRQITSNAYQHHQRNVCGYAPGVLQPLADVEPNNVEQHRYRQKPQ
jgi:hypothetical protein